MKVASNSKRNYIVAKAMYWVVAFIAALLLMSGWKASSLELEDKILFMMVHSGLGTILFALMLFRWWWRKSHKLYMSTRWYKNPLMLLQWLFYPLLVLQPVLGIRQAAFTQRLWTESP